MKKSLLSAAVASSLALASFGAAADANLYGRLDLSLTNSSTGATVQNGKEGTVLETNFSHLGVKGSESISKNLDVIYQMEFGVMNTAQDVDNPFNARNTYLGLKGGFGKALVGRNDTVFKQSEGGFDLFGNSNADIDRLVGAQTRSGDGIWYYSPKIANLLTLNATYLLSDNYETDEDMYAASVVLGDKKLKKQMFYLAGAYNKAISGMDAYRVVGQVKLAGFKLGGLYQNSESLSLSNMKGDSFILNAAYDLGGVNLKAEYGIDEAGLGKYFKNSVTADANTNDVNVTSLVLGADYKLAKSTKLWGHYAMYDGDYKSGDVKYDLEDDDIITVGIRYDF